MAGKNFMSSILDELMGRNRDALPTEVPKQVHWDDPEMCPYYLVCFCPHELFVNTKADLGPCVKFHDEQLKKKYQEEAPTYKRAQCENEFVRMAEKMIQDIEGKIKRGKLRIALANGPDGGTYAGPGSKNAEKIALLTERINSLLQEAEAAGCDGDVEKAQGLMKLCDQLKEERDQLKSNEVSHPWNPDKAMQVCEVCGSYLIIGEAQHRLDDHIMGKQHVGFAMLRKNLETIKENQEKRQVEERERISKDRDRERDREPRDNRWVDRREFQDFRGRGGRFDGRGRDDRGRGGFGYGGGRDRGDRGERFDRERNNDRDRKRHRSRSKDKKDKERHKDKKDKDKDRESKSHRDEKKRSKKSKSRSPSRDKHRHRSRSKSQDRKRKDKDRESSRSKRHKDKNRERERSPSREKTDKLGKSSPLENEVAVADTSSKMDGDGAIPGSSRSCTNNEFSDDAE